MYARLDRVRLWPGAPAGSATWFAMRLIALVLAWMLMGALVFRPAAARRVRGGYNPRCLRRTRRDHGQLCHRRLERRPHCGGRRQRRLTSRRAALGLATSLASVAVATATAWQNRDPYADTATPTTALVAVTTLAAVAAARIPTLPNA